MIDDIDDRLDSTLYPENSMWRILRISLYYFYITMTWLMICDKCWSIMHQSTCSIMLWSKMNEWWCQIEPFFLLHCTSTSTSTSMYVASKKASISEARTKGKETCSWLLIGLTCCCCCCCCCCAIKNIINTVHNPHTQTQLLALSFLRKNKHQSE